MSIEEAKQELLKEYKSLNRSEVSNMTATQENINKIQYIFKLIHLIINNRDKFCFCERNSYYKVAGNILHGTGLL